MTKNQREYVKRVRNALRAVKRRLNRPDGNRYIISNEMLPIGFDKYAKGTRLTTAEILENAPKRITKKQLENVSTKNVLKKLEYFHESGDIISETRRAFIEREAKKGITVEVKPTPIDRVKPGKAPTEGEMMYDRMYDEFSQMNNIGIVITQKLDELANKYGKSEVGYSMMDNMMDTDTFWRMVERSIHYDDAIAEFRQQIIEDMPDFILNEDDKKALRILADNSESI